MPRHHPRHPLLLTGEPGTGKKHLARLIHDISPQRQEPFLVVYCGALPPALIVIDQFEEFLILNDAAARAPLIELLHALDRTPLPGLRLLCVFRSDYRELLFKLGLPGHIPGVNAFELAPFLRAEAETFLRKGGRELSPEGYGALFAGLDRIEEARGLYRPITLNMVGLVLERMGAKITATRSG